MNLYEKIIIIDANLDDAAADESVAKIKDVITNQGGEILKTENWGRRKLSYELNKHQKGNYVFLLFKAPPTTILEIEKLCKITDTIIKFMVVKLVKKKQIEKVLASLKEAESKKESESKVQQEQKTEAAAQEVKPEGESPATQEEKESV
jgi:small subunit ribosomal protein S6